MIIFSRHFWIPFVWTSIVLGIHYATVAPGYMTGDILGSIESFQVNQISLWQSYLFFAYYFTLYKIDPEMVVAGLFQLLFTSVLVGLFWSWSIKRGLPKKLGYFLLFLLTINIYVMSETMTFSRVWLYGICLMIFLFHLYKILTNYFHQKQPASWRDIAGTSVIGTFATVLRPEVIPVLLVGLTAVAFVCAKSKLRGWVLCSIFLAVFSIFQFYIPKLYGAGNSDLHYSITHTTMNQLAYFYYKLGDNFLPPQEQAIVNKLYNHDELIKGKENHFSIWNHNQAFAGRTEMGTEAIKDFFVLCGKLVVRHFDVFMENRWLVFANAIGLSGHPHIMYPHSIRHNPIEVGDKVYQRFHLFSGWHDKLEKLRDLYLKNPVLNFISHQCYISILLIFLACGLFKFIPITAFLSGLMVIKITVLFIIMPGAVFYYFFDVIVFSYLLPGFAFVELKNRNQLNMKITQSAK